MKIDERMVLSPKLGLAAWTASVAPTPMRKRRRKVGVRRKMGQSMADLLYGTDRVAP